MLDHVLVLLCLLLGPRVAFLLLACLLLDVVGLGGLTILLGVLLALAFVPLLVVLVFTSLLLAFFVLGSTIPCVEILLVFIPSSVLVLATLLLTSPLTFSSSALFRLSTILLRVFTFVTALAMAGLSIGATAVSVGSVLSVVGVALSSWSTIDGMGLMCRFDIIDGFTYSHVAVSSLIHHLLGYFCFHACRVLCLP